MGKTDVELFSREVADVAQRDDQNVISADMPLTSEVFLHVGDQLHTFLSVKFPLHNQAGKIYAICCIASDITDRKRNEMMLHEQKERAEVTLQSIGDAVITTDANGMIDYLNPVAQQLTGWRPDQALGLPLSDVLNLIDEDSGQPLPNPVMPVLMEGKTNRLIGGCLLIRQDGTHSAIEDSAAPIRDRDGALIGTVLVFHDVSEARKITAQLAYQATHDALTDLPNRMLLSDRLEQAIASAQHHGHRIGVLFLDLDRFKNINDSLGHSAGDQLLKQVVVRLKQLVQAEDTISRQGGDEFIILIPNLVHRTSLVDLAGKIINDIALPYVVEGHELRTTFSIGISVYPDDGADVETLIKNADSAMYHAKASGRDTYQFYAEEMVTYMVRLALQGIIMCS